MNPATASTNAPPGTCVVRSPSSVASIAPSSSSATTSIGLPVCATVLPSLIADDWFASIGPRRCSPMRRFWPESAWPRRPPRPLRIGSMPAAERRPLAGVNALTKLAAAVVYFGAVSVVFDLTFQLLVLAATVAALLVLERVQPLHLLKVMVPFALMGLGYLWTNIVFHREAGLYVESLGRFSLWRNPALDDGVIVFLRTVNFGSLSFLFVSSTSPAALAQALMQRARVPPSLAFSVSGAVQFIPLLIEDLHQLRLAHRLRAPPTGGRWWRGPRRYAEMLIPLLAGSVRRAQRSAISMEARGLTHPMRRTYLHRSVFGRADAVFGVIAGLLLAAMAVGLS
ncbi:MAG: energy-coupling factor transporter transmembrane protein EcfT [Alphaproteobacteria bacterium]|nr:energy-coupling factor transporter transmembrane protein EcfT [Alphaproteobacteria bacterium]